MNSNQKLSKPKARIQREEVESTTRDTLVENKFEVHMKREYQGNNLTTSEKRGLKKILNRIGDKEIITHKTHKYDETIFWKEVLANERLKKVIKCL